MSKIAATLPGIPLSAEEDERLNRWKYLQNYSREIMSHAIAMVEATDGLTKLSAQMQLQSAVKNYLRLGGKAEDIKYIP